MGKVVIVMTVMLALSGCVGTSVYEWTNSVGRLSSADHGRLTASYSSCQAKSWEVGVYQADLATGRVPLIQTDDAVLGAAVPGYWTGRGAWWLGRGLSRSVIIAQARPVAFTDCMREEGWWHSDELLISTAENN